MRVALACDWFLPRMGGIELHLRDLALALRAHGVDAEVITTTPGPPEWEGVVVRRVRARRAPVAGVACTPAGLRAVGRAIAEGKYDVVHAHASVVSPVAYAAGISAARTGVPSVLTFHSMLHGTALLLGASDAMLGWACGGVVLSAVSSVVAAQAARWMPGADVGVLPNGIDARFWSALPPARTSGGEVRFASAMRLSRKKRPEVLLRAFAESVKFVAGSPAMRLVIAGDGPDLAALRRLAAELGVADRVELPGMLSREALRALYASAHVFALPSERESFGLAALEARAAGLPVIARMASGARDFIRHGENGLLAGDERELGRFIQRLALDAPFRDFMAARNAAAAPPYDWPEVAALHVALYDTAARRVGSASPSHR